MVVEAQSSNASALCAAKVSTTEAVSVATDPYLSVDVPVDAGDNPAENENGDGKADKTQTPTVEVVDIVEDEEETWQVAYIEVITLKGKEEDEYLLKHALSQAERRAEGGKGKKDGKGFKSGKGGKHDKGKDKFGKAGKGGKGKK